MRCGCGALRGSLAVAALLVIGTACSPPTTPDKCALGVSSGVGGSARISAGEATGECGRQITVSAVAGTGYTFNRWIEGTGSVSSANPWTFALSADRALSADFAAINYTIGTSASPSAGGTTTGSGSYSYGSDVTVTASPASGWAFVNWTENGNVVSANASYQFTVSSSRTLVANFARPCTLTLEQRSGGTIALTSGTLSGTCGRSVTVTATPDLGNTLAGWSDGAPGTSNPYTFVLDQDLTLSASFWVQLSCTLTLDVAPAGSGTAILTSGTLVGACGHSVTVLATANAGYVFQNWSDGMTTNPRTIAVNQPVQFLTAMFTTPGHYTVTTSSNPAAEATTSGGGAYTQGSLATVTATAASCYAFANWTENGSVVSASASYQFPVSGNRTLAANFTGRRTTRSRRAAARARGDDGRGRDGDVRDAANGDGDGRE